jgi:hypothetical protein
LHTDKVKKAKEGMVDTTVQEKNIPFPTDAKRYQKVIQQCSTLAQRCEMQLRQSYRLVVNAWSMPKVMPTSLGMLKKPSRL